MHNTKLIMDELFKVILTELTSEHKIRDRSEDLTGEQPGYRAGFVDGIAQAIWLVNSIYKKRTNDYEAKYKTN